MKKIIAILQLLVLSLFCAPLLVLGAEPVVINANSPVIMPIKPEQVRVLVEQNNEMSLDDAQTASDQFKQANEVGPIVSTKAYWLMFQLKKSGVFRS